MGLFVTWPGLLHYRRRGVTQIKRLRVVGTLCDRNVSRSHRSSIVGLVGLIRYGYEGEAPQYRVTRSRYPTLIGIRRDDPTIGEEALRFDNRVEEPVRLV